jgi:benzoate/toluate 1,2-dioxygenase beta subunit
MPASTILPSGLAKLELVRAIEEFLIHEVALLDRADLAAWRDLFSDDGHYWAPARPDQASPNDEISLFFDDKSIMAARVARLVQPRGHGAPLARTNHMVSNVLLEGIDPDSGDLSVSARFVMVEYRLETEPRLFGGSYHYRLRRADGTFKIAMKKAVLVNCDGAFYPLMLPF